MTRIGPPGEALEVGVTGDGPTVLLLHGFTGSSAGWSATVAGLADRHRVVVPDLLGHARSDAPHAPARYALSRQARLLGSLLTGLEAAPAAVVGYSMGARLALHLALEQPSSVRALVLEGPSAGLRDAAARARRRADDERWARRLEDEGLPAFLEAWTSQPLLASQAGLPAPVRQRLRDERLGHDPLALAASLRGAGQGAMEPLHERLAGVRVPTLVVAGALDAVGLGRAREVAERIPDAQLDVVANAGHAPHIERTDYVIALIDAFLGLPRAVTVP